MIVIFSNKRERREKNIMILTFYVALPLFCAWATKGLGGIEINALWSVSWDLQGVAIHKGSHIRHWAPTLERVHVILATFKTADCLSGAHIKRKLKSIFQHMVMHFLLADEASIPAPIASNGLSRGHWPELCKDPLFFQQFASRNTLMRSRACPP